MSQSLLQAGAVTVAEAEQVRTIVESLPEGSALAVVLENMLHAIQGGRDITIFATEQDLSTSDAALILGVSRPHVTKLMTEGVLGFHTVGNHRRCTMDDITDYIARREQAAADIAHAMGSPEQVRRDYMKLAPVTNDVNAALAELGFSAVQD